MVVREISGKRHTHYLKIIGENFRKFKMVAESEEKVPLLERLTRNVEKIDKEALMKAVIFLILALWLFQARLYDRCRDSLNKLNQRVPEERVVEDSKRKKKRKRSRSKKSRKIRRSKRSKKAKKIEHGCDCCEKCCVNKIGQI